MKAIAAAFVRAQKEFAPALKTSTNPHFKSKHPHAELATLYFSDSEMGCWMWNEGEKAWQPDYDPSFNPRFIYHVGKTAPTEPPQIMCELKPSKKPRNKLNEQPGSIPNHRNSPRWFAIH